MIKILIPALITFLHFCAPSDGKRFFLKMKGVVSNGNVYERIDNHEYHEFCVHMKCITTGEVKRVIKRIGGNIINDEFYLKNNHQLKIVTPNNCDLEEPITFHVTHLVNGYCFADGGVHAPSNYDNWVSLYLDRGYLDILGYLYLDVYSIFDSSLGSITKIHKAGLSLT